MRLLPEEISSIAEERGFSPSPVERMVRLFDVLEGFAGDEGMGPRMALVGGTALNAFHADLPRLSVDIDIHYMGAGGSVRIDDERPVFEERALRIMEGKGYTLLRNPRSDTSGRWVFGYADVHGNETPLHIDVNYAQRPPFFGVERLSSASLGDHRATDIPVVDKSEVVGGKLAALVSRERARDLFDARSIADMPGLDWRRVKFAALVLGAGDRHTDWRELSPSSIKGNFPDLQGSLEPCLPKGYLEAFGGPAGLARRYRQYLSPRAGAAVSAHGRRESVSRRGSRPGRGRREPPGRRRGNPKSDRGASDTPDAGPARSRHAAPGTGGGGKRAAAP